MRLITSNTNKSEWPKRHICDNCGAELEYDEADIHIGWMGCEYVTCLNCNCETMVDSKRITSFIWKATFDHVCTDTGAIDVLDHEVQKYVNKVAKALCSDEYETGDSAITRTGNLLVFGRKWEDEVDIYVTKDYWEDNISPEDYGMVK